MDGAIARRYGLVTTFGKIADPIADKALTGVALVGLSLLGDLSWWVTGIILVREIGVFAALGCPVLLGASRKRIIGAVTGRTDPRDRLAGTLALHTLGALQGARILRAHDVAPHVDAMQMVAAFTSHQQARA